MSKFAFTITGTVEAENKRLAREYINNVVEFGNDYVDDDEGTLIERHTVKVCTSTDPSDHQGDTCPIHEGGDK